jgi:hypothetical protein
MEASWSNYPKHFSIIMIRCYVGLATKIITPFYAKLTRKKEVIIKKSLYFFID